MKKRRILLLALVVCAVAILAAGGTLAYFTTSESADNVFTVGNVEIALTETKWDAENVKTVYPTETIAKNPVVTNTGANPCYVRISVTGLDCLRNADLSNNDVTYQTGGTDDAIGDGWVQYEDYFYYTAALEKDDATSALFDAIVIPADVINNEEGTALTIAVVAQAVQSQGAPDIANAESNDASAEALAEWFATCGMDDVASEEGA